MAAAYAPHFGSEEPGPSSMFEYLRAGAHLELCDVLRWVRAAHEQQRAGAREGDAGQEGLGDGGDLDISFYNEALLKSSGGVPKRNHWCGNHLARGGRVCLWWC
jgi:hypothetical protein